MKLSIIFITHNRKDELCRAISSCVKSGCKCTTEYIIIDNASTDCTESYVKACFPKITFKYVYLNHNIGVAGARNTAFRIANGDYLFYLDDDAIIITEHFFDKIINFMEMNPDVMVASPNIQEPKTQTDLNSRNCYISEYKEVLSFCGCAHIVRRVFFSKTNYLYPDNLMFGSEELFASLMVFQQNKKVVEIDDLYVEHYPSSINRWQGNERKFNFIFNQYIIKLMVYPKSVLWITKLFYYLHKLKNKLITSKWNQLSKEYFNERYDSKYCANRINYRQWKEIIRKFGWKGTL